MIPMEQRREPRIHVEQPVAVTVLSGQQTRHGAHVTNFSQRGMRLLMAAAIPAGAAVKVECDDAMMLGEVVYCYSAGAQYAVGLELQQAVVGVSELARLSERLLGAIERSKTGAAN